MQQNLTTRKTLSAISIALLLLITAATSARPTMAVFIPLHTQAFSSSSNKPKSKLSYASSTTEYAASAMNSVAFMKELIAEKNTDDVKYYRHPPIHRHDAAEEVEDEEKKEEDTEHDLFQEVTSDDDIHTKPQNPRSYETVCEYTGKLWFLPGGGVRFRETVWMEQPQHSQQQQIQKDENNNSLIVHCDAEYYDGKSWVECSRVTCKFVDASSTIDSCRADNKDSCPADDEDEEERFGVDMTLESELLVRLPLPGPAARAFQRLIVSTFQKAALSYFDDLLIQQQKV